MKQFPLPRPAAFLAALTLAFSPLSAGAEPSHGIAMYGAPALPPDFVSLPYANPQAPKGGRIIFGAAGSFDSLNPYIVKGSAPVGIGNLTVETLMGRSYDEPFALYGVLAESVETDDARSFVEFTLREEARFSDGSPVTVEDVLWSFEKLGTEGHPRYATAWEKIASAEATGPRSVRFTFKVEDRELPLLLGLRPILQKAQWEGKDFTASSLDPVIGSGPYIIDEFEPGRFISYKKNEGWWGKDLPFNQGLYNFDEIRYDYFADASVIFEAFKAGEITSYNEANAVNWAQNYTFPAMADGRMVKSEIPHARPSGIEGLVMNTRRPLFADWRVREALIQAFNFEQVNEAITGGLQPRIQSYFSNSGLGMAIGAPAEGDEKALLQPFAADLPPGTLEGYALPKFTGAEDRSGLKAAAALLEEAGWKVTDGVLKDAAGTPFTFEILLTQGQDDVMGAANIYIEALKRLGIEAHVTQVDSAQYKERTNTYDFDMTHYIRGLSLSPGNEQLLYWGSKGVTEPGTLNWMGASNPAIEGMISTMLSARDPADFTTAVKALDRVLTAGRYVVPIWYSDRGRIAHDARLHYPERLPLYGNFLGFNPEVWWYKE